MKVKKKTTKPNKQTKKVKKKTRTEKNNDINFRRNALYDI
jgi:hypothetical protein